MQHAAPPLSKPLMIIGWQERIGLPDLGLKNFAVKVDTGAKTTAMHAEDIETFSKERSHWVRFRGHELDGNVGEFFEFPVFTERKIRNTSGFTEERVVIRSRMTLAGRQWDIDISLTNRSSMRFPLILGRRALIDQNVAVHPSLTFLVS